MLHFEPSNKLLKYPANDLHELYYNYKAHNGKDFME